MRKYGRFWLLFVSLTAALIIMLGAGCAVAEAVVKTGSVELFAEGKLPAPPTFSMQLKGQNADFESYMVSRLKALEERIDLSSFGFSEDEFHDVYMNLLNTHPELFYVISGYSYGTDWTNNTVSYMLPYYKYEGEELEARISAFNRKVQEIVDYANGSNTVIGKLLRVNDYFCVNFQYDTSYSIYSPDELFASGKGVCQAYMMGFAAVLNELGIPNFSVVSDAMDHTWNVVQVDGSWYHVDVTWNDPVPNAPNRARHANFLRSNDGIMDTGHYGWVPGTSAASTRFDQFFWSEVDHPISLVDEVAYYTPVTGTAANRVDSYNLLTGATSTVHHYSFSFSYYFPDISPVWATPSALYYGMGDAIYMVPHEGGTPELVFSVNNADEYMFYIYHTGSEICVTTYNYSAREYKGYQFPGDAGIKYELTMKTAALMKAGSSAKMEAEMSPVNDAAVLSWMSSAPSVAAVDAEGNVTAVAPGVAIISAVCGDLQAQCTLVVCSASPLNKTNETDGIEAYAFAGTALKEAILPDGLKTIGEGAFENCGDLWLAVVPGSVESIADSAFSSGAQMLIVGTQNSAAQAFAAQKGISFVAVEDESLN